MRIHIVTSEYSGVTAYTGGIGSQYGSLAPALAAQGEELHVVTHAAEGPRTVEREGVTIVQVRVPENPVLSPVAWPLAADRALRRLPPADAVVAAEYSAGAATFALRRRRAPLVTHLHSSLIQVMANSRWSLRRRLLPQSITQRALERVQAWRSDALLAASDRVLDSARKLWPIGALPARIVPNTVDVERLRALAALPVPEELGEGGPLVAFSGRLELGKGVHVLVEAMLSIWRQHPDARLALLGGADGELNGRPMPEHLRDLAGEHGDRLLILGHLPPERLFPCLGAADVVALPSRWEAFSIAALEAMALGRPLVATSGVFPSFVRNGDNAVLVPPEDPRVLADALSTLLADRGRRDRLGTAAAATAAEHDVGPSARRFVESLTSLLGELP